MVLIRGWERGAETEISPWLDRQQNSFLSGLHHHGPVAFMSPLFTTAPPPHALSPYWFVCIALTLHDCVCAQNLRVRCCGGVEFFTRSAQKVRGALSQKFVLIDGDKAISGSYRWAVTLTHTVPASDAEEWKHKHSNKSNSAIKNYLALQQEEQSCFLLSSPPLMTCHSSVWFNLTVFVKQNIAHVTLHQ